MKLSWGTVISLCVAQALATSELALATPSLSAKLFAVHSLERSPLHLTLRTPSGIERFTFTPRTDSGGDGTHYAGTSRLRSSQREVAPAALSLGKRRGWVFFTSRRTGRPVSATLHLKGGNTTPIVSKINLKRAPHTPLACGAHAEAEEVSPAVATSGRPSHAQVSPFSGVATKRFTPARILEVATDADYEFFLEHRADTNAFIRAVLNATDVIYTSSLGIKLKVTSQRVDTTGPAESSATSALTILETFRRSPFASSSRADVRHLFTGKPIEGLTIGIAYIGAICTAQGRYAVGLSASVSQALHPFLAAHEIGHNLSAVHDQVNHSIMNPAITSANDTFSEKARTDIHDFVSTTGSCIASESLSRPELKLATRDASTFGARVSFTTLHSQECAVTLFGSPDRQRFLPLGTRSIRAAGGSKTSSATFSSPLPPLNPAQSFYFKARISCESGKKTSDLQGARYGRSGSDSAVASLGIEWLAQLRENLR